MTEARRIDWPKFWKRARAEAKERRRREYEAASPEEKARIDEAKRLREEDAARPRITVKAIRTSAWNGTSKDVDVVFVVRPGHGDKRWLHIDGGGVTGFESISLDALERFVPGEAWVACAGTKRRWDRLVVPAESLARVREVLA